MAEKRKLKFAEIISGLAAIYSIPADRALIAGYWLALEDIDIDRLEIAARHAAKTMRWFPKPVELRELTGVAGVPDSAKMAWLEVSQAAKSSSWPVDPLSAEVVRHMGGPKRLGAMKAMDLETWGRKQFEELYASLSVKVKAEGLPPHPEAAALPPATKQIVGDLAEKLSVSL